MGLRPYLDPTRKFFLALKIVQHVKSLNSPLEIRAILRYTVRRQVATTAGKFCCKVLNTATEYY